MRFNPRLVHRKNKLILILGLLICCILSVQSAYAASLDVTVLDAEFRPVNNLQIYLSQVGSHIELPMTTNPEGMCTFEGLETKEYELIVKEFDHNYYQINDPVHISEGFNIHNIIVRNKAELSIQLFYEDGTPASSTRVALESQSGAYKEVVAVGRMTNNEGIAKYPEGVPEDTYTIVIRSKSEKEIARFTETILSTKRNKLSYTIEEPSSIPSYPLASVASGIIYWVLSKRRESC